jgi:predicted RNA-binding Zn ribbon-like protein
MKRVLPVTVEAHEFSAKDFVGGDPALDFINTVTGRDQTPRDWLDSYASLLEWAERIRLLPARHLRTLAERARSKPDAAERALARAKALRETLHALVTAIIFRKAPPNDALILLRKHWIAGADAHMLCISGQRIVQQLRDDVEDLDMITWLVAHRMVEHVLAGPTERLRMCDGPNCSWVFIDSSKAGRRRWCDMTVCGNTAKSRRFQARIRKR